MDNFFLFLEIGFKHILGGYDHLLFLAGLIIVSKDIRSLFSVISAFTIAHSTTLILTALDILSINPTITETLIAVSIVFIGIENLVKKDQKYRWIIAGSFGFIHGAGFSGHLTALLKNMLGMGNIWSPVIGFNIGIELGQILVIAVTFPVVYLVKQYEKKEIFVPIVSSIIAAVGMYLVVIRLIGA